MSTPRQRQQIGYMRKLLGLDDDTYRDMLNNTYGVHSSKELTKEQASEYLDRLRDIGKETGVFKPKLKYSFNKYKYNNLGDDPYRATPAQLRKVEAMWYGISRQTTDEARAEALNKMIKKITGKQRMQFLTKTDVSKVIKAFRNMG